jgi:hypothetical protein
MTLDRAALRKALHDRYPWLADTEHGPRAVEAGECDRCGAESRLVTTCGPGADLMLGRRCAAAAGVDAWCSGHEAEARLALRWLAALPPEADVVARLWWVATGEVRLDPEVLERAVQQVLPGSSEDVGG